MNNNLEIDHETGRPLPTNAYARVVWQTPKVHVYQIPPATSTKGYQASTWTADNNKRQIFTARLRLIETQFPRPNDEPDRVTVTLLLEDASSNQLFAASPYTSPGVVEQALDSSRFFAITVVGEGRKAVLGMGFEERSEAFDFSVALQDARRDLGMEKAAPPGRKSQPVADEPKRDFSLKEGETISINLGGLKARRTKGEGSSPGPSSEMGQSEQAALFSIKPPPGPGGSSPGGGGMSFLPPPPSAKSVKEERRRSRQTFEQTPADLGFDDGEFGEFQ
ncbi:adaptin ear-binding coat-associated protein 1 NECAP-1 [Polyplosphaeria fusca]|uniref:Adaptin ear-binding coat-associated protein 1 NECAP-1 n=1 Tax=Polyplosphaeria fusca TaxID=682080 RepID=A0A9P4R1X6_9PLEO|nr:adaptin ear-binding coat-associated protein 1 NECAP-1 [Polyplosphaeria fusca]